MFPWMYVGTVLEPAMRAFRRAPMHVRQGTNGSSQGDGLGRLPLPAQRPLRHAASSPAAPSLI
jgi:hypothetical protein